MTGNGATRFLILRCEGVFFRCAIEYSLAAGTRIHRIVALDQTGQLLLIHASPAKFDFLDSRKIRDEETLSHLAVCGDEVFVRELKAISAYHWQ
jgi:hypothetical protein